MVFARCQYLTQLFIYGDSFKSVLIGIGVGNKSALTDWAAIKPNLASKSYEELLVEPETIKMVLDGGSHYAHVQVQAREHQEVPLHLSLSLSLAESS